MCVCAFGYHCHCRWQREEEGKGGMEMRAAGGCCALEFTYGVTNLWVLPNDVIYEPYCIINI